MEKTKCLIIGSGPAGYTAAIYAARADMKPVLYTGLQMGGQLTTTSEIENFPGYPEGISGPEMMEDLQRQAEKFGTEIRFGSIEKVDFSKRPFVLSADDGKTIEADTVIIATGATARYLGLESETKYRGYGVSACATCDGFFFKGLDVAVIGGGDTACEDATYLSHLCNKVYLIHRRDEFRASKAMQHKVHNTSNIELVMSSTPEEIVGDQNVTGIVVKNVADGGLRKLDVSGVFIAIGHHPNSALFQGQITLDEAGYIRTKPGTAETNIPGVFAAGDIQDRTYRQAITAAGSGCMAAISAERFLSMQE